MNPGKITKRLRREAVANPKKAAILGILAVVSIYFWIPLVRGWIGNDEAHPAAAPKTASAAAAKPSSLASPSVDPAMAKTDLPWRLIDRWMANDPRMMTATHVVIPRDPFELPRTDVAEVKSEVEPETAAKTISPSEAGLTLSGTIVGSRDRIAQINGKNYIVGQNIEIENKETMVKAAFKLSEIHPRGVVLQSGSERFELKLPEPWRSNKIEYKRSRRH